MTTPRRRTLPLVLVSAVAWAGCSPTPKPGPGPASVVAKTPFEAGEEAIGEESWQEALDMFDAVIAKEPDNAKAVYYRAVALEKLGKLDDATASYEKSLELDAKMVAARINLGAIYLDAKPPAVDKAIAVLEPAREMDAEAYDVRENLAYAYRVKGDVAKAEAYYREALKIAAHPRIHFALADVLFESGKKKESGEHYRKAWPGFTNNLDTLVVIAHRLGKTRQYEDCVKAFTAAIEIDGTEPGFFLHRGLCRHGLKQLDEERKDFESALAIDDKFVPAWYYLGMSSLKTDPAKAKEALGKAAELGGDTPIGKRARAKLETLK